MSDPVTSLAFYENNAERYANRDRLAPAQPLERFMDALPAKARILELGCGAGGDSAIMMARGFDVDPTDGSAEMARQAEARLGVPVRVLLFSAIDEQAAYDGIWANACLLHVQRSELAAVLVRVRRALRPSGVFYASYKTGGEEGLDRHGRYFNRPSQAWLRERYVEAGFATPAIVQAEGGGYDEVSDWLQVTALPA